MMRCTEINCTETFILIIGERRKVFFSVSTPNDPANTTFIVTNATYTLETSDGETVDYGYGIIEDHEIICTIQPPELGTYLLTCTCNVGEEIIKGTANISVKKKR